MRLKHIKLAGFKSFVDPTKVPFEQQMTAIVGPNGCGKSNIIDAVRWVLGESSAKNLRGDAMTDVIFNGAATRKAIGQASVELVFDNTQGRIAGNMADRSQVSVRRMVNREGANSYFLNGSKCRRRDITDIFLGTGLGPRSYAIIEQGTISRLIESKPQELRVFIEEAAGISKYKERRKETENRIRHTRENLARLTDIRLELNVQIDKLHQQAQAAKRFRTLKQQERKTKAELAVLRWQKFDQQGQQHHTRILALETKIAAQQTELSQNDLAMIALKDSILVSNDHNQSLHQQKLTVTQDIARAEQQVKYLKEQSEKTQTDIMLGADLSQHIENARRFISVRDEWSNRNYCSMTMQLTFMRSNLDEIPDLVKLAIEMGFDRIKGHQLWAHFHQLSQENLRNDIIFAERWNLVSKHCHELVATHNKTAKRPFRIDNFFELQLDDLDDIAPNGDCPFLGREIWVDPSGRFNVCCAPDQQRKSLGDFGNLSKESLPTLASSSQYHELMSSYQSHTLCKQCTMRRPS